MIAVDYIEINLATIVYLGTNLCNVWHNKE